MKRPRRPFEYHGWRSAAALAGVLVAGLRPGVRAQESVDRLVRALSVEGAAAPDVEGARRHGEEINDAMLGVRGSDVAEAVVSAAGGGSSSGEGAGTCRTAGPSSLRIAAPPSPGGPAAAEVVEPGRRGAGVSREPGRRKSRIGEMLDRFAVRVTGMINVKFFLATAIVSISWIAWNLLAPAGLQFDPAPNFMFWLFLSNVLQILLTPLILVGQSIQSRQSEARDTANFDNNVAALHLIERLEKLEAANAESKARADAMMQELEDALAADAGANVDARALVQGLAAQVDRLKGQAGSARRAVP